MLSVRLLLSSLDILDHVQQSRLPEKVLYLRQEVLLVKSRLYDPLTRRASSRQKYFPWGTTSIKSLAGTRLWTGGTKDVRTPAPFSGIGDTLKETGGSPL